MGVIKYFSDTDFPYIPPSHSLPNAYPNMSKNFLTSSSTNPISKPGNVYMHMLSVVSNYLLIFQVIFICNQKIFNYSHLIKVETGVK